MKNSALMSDFLAKIYIPLRVELGKWLERTGEEISSVKKSEQEGDHAERIYPGPGQGHVTHARRPSPKVCKYFIRG